MNVGSGTIGCVIRTSDPRFLVAWVLASAPHQVGVAAGEGWRIGGPAWGSLRGMLAEVILTSARSFRATARPPWLQLRSLGCPLRDPHTGPPILHASPRDVALGECAPRQGSGGVA